MSRWIASAALCTSLALGSSPSALATATPDPGFIDPADSKSLYSQMFTRIQIASAVDVMFWTNPQMALVASRIALIVGGMGSDT